MLAYNWDDSPRYGVWVLNTAAAGGGLIADSRLAAAVPHGWFFFDGALLTPDGRTVVAAMMRAAGNLHLHRTNYEFAEFSAATGADPGAAAVAQRDRTAGLGQPVRHRPDRADVGDERPGSGA
jgi:hypothetical protein